MDGGGLFDQTGRDVNGDGYRDGYGVLSTLVSRLH